MPVEKTGLEMLFICKNAECMEGLKNFAVTLPLVTNCDEAATSGVVKPSLLKR